MQILMEFLWGSLGHVFGILTDSFNIKISSQSYEPKSLFLSADRRLNRFSFILDQMAPMFGAPPTMSFLLP
jgi:hypothetical protein